MRGWCLNGIPFAKLREMELHLKVWCGMLGEGWLLPEPRGVPVEVEVEVEAGGGEGVREEIC